MQLHVNQLAVALYWNMYVLVGRYDSGCGEEIAIGRVKKIAEGKRICP